MSDTSFRQTRIQTNLWERVFAFRCIYHLEGDSELSDVYHSSVHGKLSQYKGREDSWSMTHGTPGVALKTLFRSLAHRCRCFHDCFSAFNRTFSFQRFRYVLGKEQDMYSAAVYRQCLTPETAAKPPTCCPSSCLFA